jgi:hypothetical protein
MKGMLSSKLKWILALLFAAGLVIVVQAALPKSNYLPVIYRQDIIITLTPTPTVTPSSTPTPSQTATQTQTIHPSITTTATQTPTNTSTATQTPTNTSTATQTPTPTTTSTPTNTSTPTQTTTPLPTHKINTMLELELSGPNSVGMGSPNPFLIEVDVTFTGPGGQTFVIPGFYDGDGAGGMDGDVWKVRFTPDVTGDWTYTSSSQEALLDGYSGAFNATSPTGCTAYTPGSLPDFNCLGRLKHSGEHYLSFANGQYWFKAGINDPEAFLDPTVNAGFANEEAAIDFLSANGVNSQYMLFHNLGGDGSFLYPWVGNNPVEAQTNHERYDLAKLADWDSIFDYSQSRGIVLHLVFEDDSGWTGFNRDLYYRQMIARFGHYNGLIWNVAEEFNETYTPDDIKGFAQMIRDLDAYDHPLTVHHMDVLDVWLPFVDDNRFDLTSFQQPLIPLASQNAAAVSWFNIVDDSTVRTIPISFDEIRYFLSPDPDPPLDQTEARHAMWGIFMGGGIYELRIYPDTTYTGFEPHIADMHRARTFMEQMPYWQMKPMNSLLVSGQGYVFAISGQEYSIYLPVGGAIDLDLTGISGTFDADWFNPRDASYQAIGSITAGSVTPFTAPSTEDWVLYLR